MTHRFRNGLIILLALTMGVSLIVPPVQAVEYGGVGARPANPDENNSRTQSIFVYSIEPSNIKNDGVTVYNNTSETKTIAVYAVDGKTSNTGAFACAQKVSDKTNVGAWLNLETNEVTLGPNQSRTVDFTVTVPPDTEVGEHNGCIVVQEQDTRTNQNGVVLNFRSAIRVSVTIPGDIIKSLAFEDYIVTKQENGDYNLTPTLKNDGNVSLDAGIKVEVKSLLGATVYENGGKFPVLAGDSASQNFKMPKPFWGGVYTTRAMAEYNSDPVALIGEEGDLTFINTASSLMFTPPHPTALAIEGAVLLVVLVGGFLLIRKQRDVGHMRKTWATYYPKGGDDIKSLGNRYNVSWKTLARVNKLKAPYILKNGKAILVPKKSSRR